MCGDQKRGKEIMSAYHHSSVPVVMRQSTEIERKREKESSKRISQSITDHRSQKEREKERERE